MSCLDKANDRVKARPAAGPTEAAHSAAVTPTGPPANSRKRRLLLSTPRDGNYLSPVEVQAEEANGEAGADGREKETAT